MIARRIALRRMHTQNRRDIFYAAILGERIELYKKAVLRRMSERRDVPCPRGCRIIGLRPRPDKPSFLEEAMQVLRQVVHLITPFHLHLTNPGQPQAVATSIEKRLRGQLLKTLPARHVDPVLVPYPIEGSN